MLENKQIQHEVALTLKDGITSVMEDINDSLRKESNARIERLQAAVSEKRSMIGELEDKLLELQRDPAFFLRKLRFVSKNM